MPDRIVKFSSLRGKTAVAMLLVLGALQVLEIATGEAGLLDWASAIVCFAAVTGTFVLWRRM